MMAKEFLNRAYRIDCRINNKCEQLERLKALASSASMNYGGAQVSHSRKTDALENNILHIIEAEHELDEQIDMLIDMKKEIQQVIDLVADPDCRVLLEMRYLCMKRWQDIGATMELGRTQTYKLHMKALAMVETVLRTMEAQHG